jgi:hypothetical protein
LRSCKEEKSAQGFTNIVKLPGFKSDHLPIRLIHYSILSWTVEKPRLFKLPMNAMQISFWIDERKARRIARHAHECARL